MDQVTRQQQLSRAEAQGRGPAVNLQDPGEPVAVLARSAEIASSVSLQQEQNQLRPRWVGGSTFLAMAAATPRQETAESLEGCCQGKDTEKALNGGNGHTPTITSQSGAPQTPGCQRSQGAPCPQGQSEPSAGHHGVPKCSPFKNPGHWTSHCNPAPAPIPPPPPNRVTKKVNEPSA